MNLEKIKPEDVEIIDIDDSNWNCNKCLFFISKDCECRAGKRLLFGQALGSDCNDCKRPFVLKSNKQQQ